MRAAAVLLIALCLLTACGDDGNAPPVPTATATAVATPTATASPPSATATATLPPPTASATPSRPTTRTATAPSTATLTPTASPTATPTASPSATPTATPSGVPTLEPLAVHADSDWIRDARGRVVLLRGANYSGLEFGNFIGNPNGPDESDFAQMESWGFNVVRLPIAWSYLEAAPNQLDDTYLREQVDRVVDFAARHGILVVLEMHQFNWARCFTNGNGAPAWVCEGHDYSDDFRGAVNAGCDFIQGAMAADGRSLQDHFVDVWRLVARHYAGDRRIAGIDFLNEPHAYGCTTDPATLTHALYELYRRLRTAVQDEGATQTFVAEPPVVRNLGIPITAEPLGPDVVYAPHLYTQSGGLPEIKYNGDASTITADYALATSEAQGFGGPLIAGEYGGNTNPDNGFRAATELFLRDTLAEQDRRLVGGAVWAYFPSDNTFSVVDAAGNEKGELVNILARPYARRVAGVPTAMRYDVDSTEFVFSWRIDGAAPGDGITELFIPRRHYPDPLALELPPGVTMAPRAENQTVVLSATAPGEYTVRVQRQ